MHRQSLLKLLDQHVPWDDRESASLVLMKDFVSAHADCFHRTLQIGHLTGSAWLVNPTNDKVLLTHHRKLNMWLQLGGHADGHPDLLEAAIREAVEESGIKHVNPLDHRIFDLDVHEIPAHGHEPAHQHYDVRFLLQAVETEQFVISDESHELSWFSADQVDLLDVDQSVRRMNAKWRNLRQSGKNPYPHA